MTDEDVKEVVRQIKASMAIEFQEVNKRLDLLRDAMADVEIRYFQAFKDFERKLRDHNHIGGK